MSSMTTPDGDGGHGGPALHAAGAGSQLLKPLMTKPSEKCPELPAPPGRIAAFAVMALVAGIALAVWIDRPGGPKCIGILSARTTFVTAETEGTLAEFLVSEGEPVSIGDPLIRMTDERLERSILAKRREISSLESELQRALATAELELKWRTRTVEAEICEIQLRSATFLKEKFDYELQRSMLADLLSGNDVVTLDGGPSSPEPWLPEVWSSNHGNDPLVLMRRPRPERLTTVLHLEAAANAAEVSAAQVEICEMRQQRLERLKEELPNQVRRTAGVDVAEANLARAREELEQMEAEQNDLTVPSPAIGTVGVFRVRRGDHLVPGTPIVELLDDSQRHLVVNVPSQEITSFGLGTRLKLLFPGKVEREGKVVRISPQATHSAGQGPPDADTTILVHVEQKGRLWPEVPIGSQVRVQLAR
jgi:multidrug resistance efflux pump